jgi:ABC-type dipeptide/oligopeptide/nickel transport system permease component
MRTAGRRGGPGSLAVAFFGRFLYFIATLAGAIGLVMLLLALAPGDPIDLLPNSEEVRPELEARWNLGHSLPVRYGLYLSQLAQGDLGVSLAYRPGMPVTEVLGGPLLRSAGLLLSSWSLALLWGISLAWYTAGRGARTIFFLQFVSITPVFLLAHLAIFGFNTTAWSLMEAGSISRPGWFALPDQASTLRTALAVIILAIGSGSLSEIHKDVENALVEVRQSGFVDAARARGTPLWPHLAWNLIAPLSSIAVSRSAFLVGGLIIIEKVMLLNGAGSILWRAAQLRDYDLCLGVALFAAMVVAGTRFVADILRISIDPRLRISS